MTTYEQYVSGRGLSTSTVRARLRFYAGRVAAWGPLHHVPQGEVTAYLYSYDGWTRCTYYGHLMSIYDWMLEAGLVARNFVRDLPRPKSPAPAPRPLSADEIGRALRAAGPRAADYLMLGYLAGLRAHEIAKFHGKDVNSTELYVMGKGRRPATIPTHPGLWELAQMYPREAYWFPSPAAHREHVSAHTVTVTVSNLFARIGIVGATHRARHTYGTQLLRSGANLRVVQELMRHSSLATTARYLGVDREEKIAAIASLVAA